MVDDITVVKGVVKGQPCLDQKNCGSSDAMAIYFPEDADGNKLDENAYCFSCERAFNKSQLAPLGFDKPDGVQQYLQRTKAVKKSAGTWITKEQIDEIRKKTSVVGQNFRGIDNDTLKYYKVLTEIRQGVVVKRYYPNTIGYKPASYQVRVVDGKIFFFIGKAGLDLDFFGQRLYKDGGKRLLIVGGQEDCLAASQMLWNYRVSKKQTGYGRDAVVSTPSGEKCAAYVKKQYAWLDSFDEILIGLDNDKAGLEAVESMLPHMPKGKVKIIKWTGKDPNEMLQKGMQTKFIDDYFNAKKHVPIGILDTSTLGDKLRETIMLPKVELPLFMGELQNMLAGGIPFRKIINIAAETAVGKCLGRDTPVLMYDMTIKAVQDVVVGDVLMGDDGTPRNVLSTTSGQELMYRVDQKHGDSYTVNSSHILSLRCSTDIRGIGKRGDIVNINVEDYLKLTKTQQVMLKGYKADLINLCNSGELVDPYIIGIWLADGNSSTAGITVGDTSPEVLESIHSFCEVSGYTVTTPHNRGSSGCDTVHLKGGFYKDLDGYNLRGSDLKGNKHIPQAYLTASREVRLELLAGLIDGDGHLVHKCYDLVFKDTPLVDDVILLARGLGYKVTVKDKFSKCQGFEGAVYKRLTISGHTDRIPTRVARKVASKRLMNKSPTNTGINVTAIGDGEYFGFEIDGNKLFCLGDFTVTHNTSLVNEIVYHWIFQPQCRVAVVTLELDAPEYAMTLLSRHVGKKLQLFSKPEDAIHFINQDWVKAKEHDLYYTENGDPRWYLVDDRTTSVEDIKDKVEELIISFGCNVIVFDPLSDMIARRPLDEQEDFMAWQKALKKQHDVIFLNVNHVRGSSTAQEKGQDKVRFLTEDDIMGSTSIPKSADCNILLSRNKYAEDLMVRNTTQVWLPKCRWTGNTGRAGDWFYHNDTHKLYDLNYYKAFVEQHGAQGA